MKTISYHYKLILSLFFTALLAGCGMFQPPPPPPTPLQIQTMQTRHFQAGKKATFQATMTALQNLGYTIQNSNLKAGTINVTGPAHSSSQDVGPLFNIVCEDHHCHSVDNNTQPNQVTTSTVGSITIMPVSKKETSVRLNFTEKDTTSSSHGQQSENDHQIISNNFYQNFFNQIRQSLFISSAVK